MAEDEGTASLALEAPAALRPCVSPPMEHCAAVAGEGSDAVPGDRNCPWADDAVRAATDLMSASVPAVVAARFGAVIQRHIVVGLARAILLVAVDQEVGWGQCRGLRWRWGDKLPQLAIVAIRPKLRGRRASRANSPRRSRTRKPKGHSGDEDTRKGKGRPRPSLLSWQTRARSREASP